MPDILKREVVYKGYRTIELVTVRLADGSLLEREVQTHGHAVAILPYDPERRMALVIRQFRMAVKVASGLDSLLEAAAGMIDRGESADAAARREAMEETGLQLRTLDLVATAWPSCGVSTETMALYLAEYSAADRIAPGGGLATEQEDITVVETPLADLVDLGADGEVVDLKLLALVQTLRLRRPDLFV